MDEATRRDWAGRIKHERERQGISRSDLAAAADVSLKTLANMERGDHAPQEQKLRAVLRALGLSDHDPQLDTDTDALLVLLGSLIRRLPPEYVAEWSRRVTGELATAIAESETAKASPIDYDDLADLLRQAGNGDEPGESGVTPRTG